MRISVSLSHQLALLSRLFPYALHQSNSPTKLSMHRHYSGLIKDADIIVVQHDLLVNPLHSVLPLIAFVKISVFVESKMIPLTVNI